MAFDIFIRMKINGAEYIEYPIVTVVKQTPHGYTRVEVGKQATRIIVWCSFRGHPWRLHRAEAQAPPHIVCFRAYTARYT